MLHWPPLPHTHTHSHSIALEFRTSSSDALLLYTQDVVAVFADYLSLELRGGRLNYSYNLGSGRVFITSNHTYNDGLLHIVSGLVTRLYLSDFDLQVWLGQNKRVMYI